MLSRHMLKEILIDESHIKPNTMMVRAYDGLPRQIMRTLEVELYVAIYVFCDTLGDEYPPFQ